MKVQLLIGATVASLIMAGCGSSDNTSNTNTSMGGSPTMDANSTRFTKMTMMGDTVEQDNQTKLEWVGSSGSNGTSACQPHPAATTEAADIAGAKAHCDALTFAGHSDWRVATPEEHKMFIQGMKDADMTPFYQNPACPRLIGVDANGKAKAVNTHNSTPVGDMQTWDTLLRSSATNYGVKCVRKF
jgi:hypothetical protein